MSLPKVGGQSESRSLCPSGGTVVALGAVAISLLATAYLIARSMTRGGGFDFSTAVASLMTLSPALVGAAYCAQQLTKRKGKRTEDEEFVVETRGGDSQTQPWRGAIAERVASGGEYVARGP